jgi:hypothetical protein
MKNVDFYFWMIPQPRPKKPRRSAWRMTLEEGRERYPGCYPDFTSKEVRRLPETVQEREFRGPGMRTDAPGARFSDWTPDKKD